MTKPLLIEHLSGKNVGRFPVWMMRQAGRYLDSYREIRKQYSFWDSITNPEIAYQITMLPIRELPVDAAILFSDILTLPFGIGIPVEMKEAVGPVLSTPLSQRKDFDIFSTFNAQKHVPFVGEALEKLRKELPPEKTLIGFAGAPWTVGCYLIEGRVQKKFDKILRWMYSNPKDLAESLNNLADSTAQYLNYQVECGANIVQVFDTWLSEMPIEFYRTYYHHTLLRIFSQVKGPIIYFARHSHHLLPLFKELPVTVVSVDSLRPMSEIDTVLQGKFSLQGNLDSHWLFSSPEVVREKAIALREEAKKLTKPAIINLGHGILPQTPMASVRAFLEEVTRPWN